MYKNLFGITVLAIFLFVGGSFWSKSLEKKDPTLVSPGPIHWHPSLAIIIDGVEQDIPAGIGLQGGHKPIHTHDDETDRRETSSADFTHKPLHLEFNSTVRKKDIRLGNFFTNWNKRFTAECIFDYCTNDGGTLEMFVNGIQNTDFEEYIMKDGDEIDIVYTSTSTQSNTQAE